MSVFKFPDVEENFDLVPINKIKNKVPTNQLSENEINIELNNKLN